VLLQEKLSYQVVGKDLKGAKAELAVGKGRGKESAVSEGKILVGVIRKEEGRACVRSGVTAPGIG